MLSTDLPVTEWWDPDDELYVVQPFPDDSIPFALWHDAYMHQAWLEWITTGHTWGWPNGLLARQLEPVRRPPSWYPGQPDPPRVRVDRCSCLYVRKYATMALPASVGARAVERFRYIASTAFLIDEQCTHHGIAALEHDEFDDAYPDGGVWGFTLEDT